MNIRGTAYRCSPGLQPLLSTQMLKKNRLKSRYNGFIASNNILTRSRTSMLETKKHTQQTSHINAQRQ